MALEVTYNCPYCAGFIRGIGIDKIICPACHLTSQGPSAAAFEEALGHCQEALANWRLMGDDLTGDAYANQGRIGKAINELYKAAKALTNTTSDLANWSR